MAIKTVAIVLFKEACVLLVKHIEGASHPNGVYGLPGGRKDKGETSVEAAKRELEQETGLHVKLEDLKKLPIVYEEAIKSKTGSSQHMTMEVYLCTNFSGTLLKESNETIPEWVEIGELIDITLLPNVLNAIREAKN